MKRIFAAGRAGVNEYRKRSDSILNRGLSGWECGLGRRIGWKLAVNRRSARPRARPAGEARWLRGADTGPAKQVTPGAEDDWFLRGPGSELVPPN